MTSHLDTVRKLESELDPIIAMYDFAEKQYGYNNLHGGDRQLNEDLHRKEMQTTASFGPTSTEVLKGSSWGGVLGAWLFTRRSAAHVLDFSPLRACYFRTAAFYLIGVSLTQMVMLTQAQKQASKQRRLLNTRVSQIDQTHNVLKTMKFHLATRQMPMWDQLGL